MRPFWADGHLDLAYLAVNGRDMRAAVPPDAPHSLTLASMREGGVRALYRVRALWERGVRVQKRGGGG